MRRFIACLAAAIGVGGIAAGAVFARSHSDPRMGSATAGRSAPSRLSVAPTTVGPFTVPPGPIAGHCSSKANGAWGSLNDRMTPSIAAHNFFITLMLIPDWKTLTPTQAAHSMQINANAIFYTWYWSDAATVVAALTGTAVPAGWPARSSEVDLADGAALEGLDLVEERTDGSILRRQMKLNLFCLLKNRPRILIGRRRPSISRGGLDVLADDDHRKQH